MWIGLNDGWLSIVRNINDNETLLVRARSLSHLTNVFPDCDYFLDENADYTYRAYIGRVEVANVLSDRIMKISYPNFKASVEDRKLLNVYSSVWADFYYGYFDERR